MAELKLACHEHYINATQIEPVKITAAIRQMIENLAAKIELEKLGSKLVLKFNNVFEPILHVDHLLTDVYCTIELKEATKNITSRSYSMPQKYCEAWKTLIEQHIQAGQLLPSNSAHASPAFLVPKPDPNNLPQWVNDYRVLNVNTILNAFPLPQVDDIPADCVQASN